MRNKRGITLIALVITIVILLILAVLTVKGILGENGLISKAKWTGFVSNIYQVEEQEKLLAFEQEVDKKINEGKSFRIADLDTTKIAYVSQGNTAEDLMQSKETYYKIKGNRLSNKGLEEIESLKTTISQIENTENFEDNNDNLVFYEVDKEALKLNIKQDYIINIISGKVYQYKPLKLNGKLYHRPDAGMVDVEEDAELIINPDNIELVEGQMSLLNITYGDKHIDSSDIVWINNDVENSSETESSDEVENDDQIEAGDNQNVDAKNDYDDGIVSIKNSAVLGEVIGETEIIAIYKVDGKEKGRATLKVKVTSPDELTDEQLQSVNIAEFTATVPDMHVCKALKKGIKVVNSSNKKIANTKFNWVVEDPTKLSVNSKGVLKPLDGSQAGTKVKVIGTLKADSSKKVECEATIYKLETFTPELSINKKNLVINSTIDKKYGGPRLYYKYKINGVDVSSKWKYGALRSQTTKYTAKNIIEGDTLYTVEVTVKIHGTYEVTGTATIRSPKYFEYYEICNISPYGYDVYVHGVLSEITSVEDVVTAPGLSSYTTSMTKLTDGTTYYLRVNKENYQNVSGEYNNTINLKQSGIVYEKIENKKANIPVINTTVTNITADSLVAGVRDNNIPSGYCNMTVNELTYNLEVFNLEDIINPKMDGTAYDLGDFSVGTYNIGLNEDSGTYNKGRTAVIKCKGSVVINGTVTTAVGNISGYAGLTTVKGLFVCVKGNLTNNGEINMTARGTCNTRGEDIYLWKNLNPVEGQEQYETVPAVGASGGKGAVATTNGSRLYNDYGYQGENGTKRKTGGGGSGGASRWADRKGGKSTSQAGGTGTSYSGGSGSGGIRVDASNATSYTNSSIPSNYGGVGGDGLGRQGNSTPNIYGGGGAGNPGGTGYYSTGSSNKKTWTGGVGSTGTGGLLIIYANEFNNLGTIKSNGSPGGPVNSASGGISGGGGSGAGSINIFGNVLNSGNIEAIGVYGGTVNNDGGKGGSGSITIGTITSGTFINN